MSGEDDHSRSVDGAHEEALIRRDRDREHLRGLLLEGASSERAPPIDATYFDMLRRRISVGSTDS